MMMEQTVERYVMNKGMHMGPINRQLSEDDVLTWNADADVMTVNGRQLPNDGRSKESTEGFAEVARILKKQAEDNPHEAWAEIMPAETVEGAGNAKTDTLTVFPILGCLFAAEEFIGKDVNWAPKTDEQTQFIELFEEYLKDVPSLDCLERKADIDVEPINAWLKERGFNIQLDPVAGGFAVASILDVLVKWLKKGDKTEIRNAKGTFEAVKLKEGIAAYRGRQHKYPVVRIRTQSDDVVCMSIVEELPKDTFAINWKVEQLRQVQKPIGCDAVIFPMVKYDEQVDISWIEGMVAETGSPNPNGDFFIAQALQQTKFRMNEVGARAESAVAMTLRCCAMAAPDSIIVIDRPFLLWIERDGVSLPLFAGTFAEDVWENPGGLD